MFTIKSLADRPLIKSILALLTSSLLGRIMGSVYKVALVRAAGQDAVGLIQLALPVYRIARSLATLGLPVAIAKLTAERSELLREPDLVPYRRALALMVKMALIAFAVQTLYSHFFAAQILADLRTEPAIVILAVMLIPIVFTAALRGVMQGLQRQDYIAGSDILEVMVRISVTLILVSYVRPREPAYLAAAIAWGFLAGELASWLVLRLSLNKAVADYAGRRPHRPKMECPPLRLQHLLSLGVPMMLTGLLNNVMSLITVASIPRLLQRGGATLQEATRSYGRLAGMAIPTLYMPMMLILPVTQIMLPELTRLNAQSAAGSLARTKKLLRKVYSGALGIGLLVGPLLWWGGDRLGAILYADASIGELIRPLGIVAPFTFVGAVSADVLYSLGQSVWVLASSLVGNLLRLLLVYSLAAHPAWGIRGVLWAIIADCIFTAILQIIGVWRAFRR